MRSAAILGCGRMGREHAEAYRELGVPIHSMTDPDHRKAWELAREFGGRATEFPMPPPSGEPGYVSVCSWDDSHESYIAEALERGATVIAEKPLCQTLTGLTRVATLGGRLACNLPLRFAFEPSARPYHVQADYIWGRADQLTGWRKECPGYSFVLGGGVHAADLICRYGRPLHVTAMANDPGEFAAPTVIAASGRFEDGRTFRMDINCANIGEHTAHVIEWLPRGRREFRIDGSDKRQTISEAVLHDRLHPGFEAHALCFAIERSLSSRQVERVLYPCG